MRERVTVVVVNWNGRKFLEHCLNGLKRQTYPYFSTIMVDNGSTDGSIDYVKKYFPSVEIISLSKNMGFSAANNIAINRAKTEFVALLNNDAVAHENWLSHLVNSIEKYPEAGFLASKMLFYDDPTCIDRAGDAYSWAGAGILRGRGQVSEAFDQVEWVFGACAGAALYRKSMLEEIGLFDEDFFLLYEDVDLSFRAQLNGYRCLYIPDAIVFHMATKSIGFDSKTSIYYSHRNLEWVYFKSMPYPVLLKSLWLHILYGFFAFVYFAIRGHGYTYVKSKYDALKKIKKIIKIRGYIQSKRCVSSRYIEQLLLKEYFIDRYLKRSK